MRAKRSTPPFIAHFRALETSLFRKIVFWTSSAQKGRTHRHVGPDDSRILRGSKNIPSRSIAEQKWYRVLREPRSVVFSAIKNAERL